MGEQEQSVLGLLTKLLSLQASRTLSQNVPESQVTQPPKGQEFSAQVFTAFFNCGIISKCRLLYNCVDWFGTKVILIPGVHSYFPGIVHCSNREECA